MKVNDVVVVVNSFAGIEVGSPLLVKLPLGEPFLLVTDGYRDYLINKQNVSIWSAYPQQEVVENAGS